MKTKLLININRIIAFAGIFFLGITATYSQIGYNSDAGVEFQPRQLTNGETSVTLEGDLIFAANNILNRRSNSISVSTPYNGPNSNNNFSRDYINVDPDGGNNFSSSTAFLDIPSCSRIEWAGLYWSGSFISNVYGNDGRNSTDPIPGLPSQDLNRDDFRTVRLRIPGGGYVDVTADTNADPVGEEDDVIYDAAFRIKDRPYACFKNVTNLLQSIPEATGAGGNYTVGNVRATRGVSDGGAGGWTLLVIYEDPTLPTRHITVFDGFKWISAGEADVPISVSGFTAVPVGAVRSKIVVGALEGDVGLGGDQFLFEASTSPFGPQNLGSTTPGQPNRTNNFFDGSITVNGAHLAPRNILSQNTLGYDTDLFDIPTGMIPNDETAAEFTLTTSADSYGAFLVAFGIDVIQPDIQLVKNVRSPGTNTDIEGAEVNLGDFVDYVISFHNVGNDDATGLTITDILPANVDYINDPSLLTLPPGMPLPVYDGSDPLNRTLTFTVPDNMVLKDLPDPFEIVFRAQVVATCELLRDACSDQINNQAFASYSGIETGVIISDDPSFYGFDTCDFGLPGSTNILADRGTCGRPEETLCGDSIELTAGTGYDNYQWYDNVVLDVNGDLVSSTPISGETGQTLTVTTPGIYRVFQSINDTGGVDSCREFNIFFTVTPFTNSLVNPIEEAIDDGFINGSTPVCSNTPGEDHPKVFLCGTTGNNVIDTNINGATSIIWEKFDASLALATCVDPGTYGDDCPNTNNQCESAWVDVDTGNDFTISTTDGAGEYRLRVIYQNSCQRTFYFDVYTNDLVPDDTFGDIICGIPGFITVDTPPASAGYEYQLMRITNVDADLDGELDEVIEVPFQSATSTFSIPNPGNYYVSIQQTGVVDPSIAVCPFRTTTRTINEIDPEIGLTVIQPICGDDLGTANLQISNGIGQYELLLERTSSPAGPLSPVETVVSPTPQNSPVFSVSDLQFGDYTATITSTYDDGVGFPTNCTRDTIFTIAPTSTLALSADVSQNITCREGNILMNPSSGQPPYRYRILTLDGNPYPATNPVHQSSNIFNIPLDGEGTYIFEVLDNNGCTATDSATIIIVPDIVFSPQETDETCAGADDGRININVTDNGGYNNLSYSIDGGASFSAVFDHTGLAPDTYSVIVRGTRGNSTCDSDAVSVTINAVDPLSADLVPADPTCSNPNGGSIVINNPTGGAAGGTTYQYSIDGGTNWLPANPGTTASFTFPSLAGGGYSIIMRDFNNQSCTRTYTPSLTVISGPTLDAIANPAITCNPGTGTPGTASITLTSTGGTGTLVYTGIETATLNPVTPTVPGGNQFDGLTSGTQYTFTVTDANGCDNSGGVTIPTITPITISDPADDTICFSDSDGALTFNVGNFTATYSYSLNGAAAVTGQTAATIPLTALGPGTYSIEVTDETTNCVATAEADVIESPQITLGEDSRQEPNCTNSGQGEITFTAGGGIGALTYNLTGDATVNNNTGVFSGLIGTNYSMTVVDANGCPGPVIPFTLTPAVIPTVVLTSAGCFDGTANAITLTATPNPVVGNYEYVLDGVIPAIANTTGVFNNNISVGTHTVVVTNVDTGCSATSNTITVNPELELSLPNVTISACATTADIVSSGSGGDGNFVYAIVDSGATAPANGDYLAGNSTSTQAIPAGVNDSFDVYVRDNNGTGTVNVDFCQVMETVTVTREAAIVIAPIGPIALACNGDTNGEIDASSSVTNGRAPYQYELSGGTLGAAETNTTGVFNTSLGAGTYTLVVRDNTGDASGNTDFCEESITITITEPAAIAATASRTREYTCAEEAQISVNITGGGSGLYQVRIGSSNWEPAAGVGTGVFLFPNTFTDGDYTVQVRDFNATICPFTIIPDVNVPALPPLPDVGVDVTYNCDGTGIITTTVTPAAVAPVVYQYELQDGSGNPIAGFTFANQLGNNVFDNVPVGNYEVVVDYGNGNANVGNTCTTPPTAASVATGNVFAMEITSHTDITCNGVNDGTITFQVTNFSVGGYQYGTDPTFTTIIGTSTNAEETVPNLPQGTNTIYVRDTRDTSDSACILDDSEDIDEPDPIVITADVTDPATCNNSSLATIEVLTAVGGSLSYEFELFDTAGAGTIITAFSATDTFTDVPVGNYLVRVRDAVTNTCVGPAIPVEVEAPDSVVFDATPTNCYNASANNGEIEILVTGGNTNYLFSINEDVDPTGPFNVSNGGATTVPEGHTFTNLVPGDYEVTVRDGFGCETTLIRTINAEIQASANLDRDISCSPPPTDAQITISPSGGAGTVPTDYTYEVSSSSDGGATFSAYSPIASEVFNTTTAAIYRFRVTDALGCPFETNEVLVTPAPQPVITSVTPTPVNCFGESTGALDVVIDTTIGLPPYTTQVFEDDGTGNPTGPALGGLTALPADEYVVIITDSKGCVSNPFAVEVLENTLIDPQASSTNILCDDTSLGGVGTVRGTIDIDATGGVGPYTYVTVKDDNSFTSTYDTSVNPNLQQITNLDPGVYTITVTDNLGCSVETTETVASPAGILLTADGAAACLAGSGTMFVTAQAAVPPLTTGTFFFALYPATPYFVGNPEWFAADQDPGSLGFDHAFEFTTLDPGVNYTFIVYDDNTGCEFIQDATVPVNSQSTLAANLDPAVDVTCSGFDDGSITFEVDGTTLGAGATTVNYEIYDANTNQPLTTPITGTTPPDVPVTEGGLAPGTYYILFEEFDGANAGCVIPSPDFPINEAPVPLTIGVPSSTNDDTCSVNGLGAPIDVGTVTVSAQNGEAPLQFQLELASAVAPDAGSWTGTNTTGVFNNQANGNYTVYVKDANDCIREADITVGLDASPEISVAIVDNCVDEGTFSVTVTLDVAGLTLYTLSVNGQPAQTVTFPHTISDLSSGLGQTVEVFDLNGCGEQETFDIFPPMDFTPTVTELLDCDTSTPTSENAVIRIVTTQGTGVLANYVYEIDGPGASDQATTALPSFDFTWDLADVAGDYIITVRDAGNPNVCPVTKTENVPVLTPPVMTLVDFGNETCNPGSTGGDPTVTNDGFITVNVEDNGFGPFTFEIIDIDGAASGALPTTTDGYTATFSTLTSAIAPGYRIQATSTINDCETNIITQPIAEPADIVITTNPTQFTCTANVQANASIEITNVVGGIVTVPGTYVRYEFVPPGGSTDIIQANSSLTYNVTDLSGGIYTINVYDENGCVGTTTETITPIFEIADPSAAVATPIVCGGTESINVTLNTVNNPASIALDLDYVVTETDGTAVPGSTVLGTSDNPRLITGLNIGTYIITVTNNLTGCSVVTNYEVRDPNTFTIDVDQVSNVSCVGASDGQVNFTLVDPLGGYTGPFTYDVLDAATGLVSQIAGPIAFAGPGLTTPNVSLGAGDYIVRIVQTANPLCPNEETFSIIEPAIALDANVSVTPITCDDGGIITVINAAGGWGDYTYYIELFSAGNPAVGDFTTAQISRNGLVAGRYQAWIKDVENCMVLIDDNIILTDPITIAATLTPTYNCTTGTDGQISVTGTTGGIQHIIPPSVTPEVNEYTYQLYRDGNPYEGPITQTIPGPPDALFTNLGPGVYTVEVTDQLGCSNFVGAPIEFYELMNAQPEITNALTCARNDGEITITVTGGSGNFQFDGLEPDGLTALAAPTVTVTATGVEAVFGGLDDTSADHTFTITDLDTAVPGPPCTTNTAQSLVEPVDPIATAPDGVTSCAGLDDGTVQIAIDPTTVTDIPYVYTLTTLNTVAIPVPPTNNTGYFDGLAIGTYEYSVTSNIGCSTTGSFIITEPIALALTLTESSLTFECTPTNTPGIITIVATTFGGSNDYLYSLNGGTFGTQSIFEIPDSGVNQTVTIRVIDAQSGELCFDEDSRNLITIPVITDVIVTPGVALDCNPLNPDGTITVEVVGGSGNFTVTNLRNSDVQPTVTTGLTETATFTITDPGDYAFEVIDNITSCRYITDPLEIPEYDVIEVTGVAVQPVECIDGYEGTMEITVLNYPATAGDPDAYSYEVFEIDGITPALDILGNPIIGTSTVAANPTTITGLGVGSYIVRVLATDTPFCDADSNVVPILGPGAPLMVTLDISSDLTCDMDNGGLTAVAQGGWGDYEYRLLVGAALTPHPTYGTFTSNNVFTGLSGSLGAGLLYTVQVRDSGDCVVEDDETLIQPALITVPNPTATVLLCEGDDDAVITLDETLVTGGRGATFYSYILNNVNTGFVETIQDNGTFIGISAGTYTVTVEDGWNCDATSGQVTIDDPIDIFPEGSIVTPLTCDALAEIQLGATGGTAPYGYGTTQTGPFTPIGGPISVDVGIYEYYIQDANGCVTEIPIRIEIEEIPDLEFDIDDSVLFVTCAGLETGIIRVNATGGLGAYTYELYDANPLPINAPAIAPIRGTQNTSEFNLLPPGNSYYVRVVSEGNCFEVGGPYIITEPAPLVELQREAIDPSCTGEDDGRIVYEVGGGTGTIKYAMTNAADADPSLQQFDENFVFENLSAGTYYVIAQDERGCYIVEEFILADPTPVIATEGVIEQEFCVGDLTGSIQVLIEGGTPPYTAAITYPGDPSALVYETVADVPSPAPHTFSALAGGITYTILIQDANECNGNIDVTLDTPVNLTSDTLVEYGCFENTSTNSVTVIHEDPTVLDSDVIYVLDGTGAGQLENVFENLTPGEHFIEMSLDGCVRETLPFEIIFVEDLTFTFLPGTINQILFEPTGGVPPYEYFIDGTTTIDETSYYINHTDTYTITVIDSRGCTYRDDIYMEFIDIDIPPVFTPNGDGSQDEWQIVNDEGFPNIVTKVYDRYGRWLGTLNQGDRWKGIYDNNALPTGDYWYVLKINGENDPREFVGHFTLYR